MQIAGMSLNFHPFLQSSTMFTTENRVQWDLDFGRILMCVSPHPFLHPGWDFLDFCTWKFSTND